nr:MAG TPA: hypothetical protein [Bacteriophage sp.]
MTIPNQSSYLICGSPLVNFVNLKLLKQLKNY